MTSCSALSTLKRSLPADMIAVQRDGEIRVSFSIYHAQAKLGLDYRSARQRCEDVAYYTDCPLDALGTAQQMARCGLSA